MRNSRSRAEMGVRLRRAEIEIGEGPEMPARDGPLLCQGGVSRSDARRSVALPAVRSGELRPSALVADRPFLSIGFQI